MDRALALRAKVKGRRLVNAATKQWIRVTLSMARALSYDAGLIVIDEPSVALARDEITNLFRGDFVLTEEKVWPYQDIDLAYLDKVGYVRA